MDDDFFEGYSFGAAVLPVQFNGAIGRRGDLSGERRLLLAVLEDAIRWYLKSPSRVNGEQANATREARHWIEAPGDRGICAYETICDLLGIDAGALRLALRRAVSRGCSRLRLRDARGRCGPLTPDRRRKTELAA